MTTLTQKFELFGGNFEPITSLQVQALANGWDQSDDFVFKVRRVVDDIEVGMSDPGGGSFRVQFLSQRDILGPGIMLMGRVELFRALGRRHHVHDLIVAIIADLDRVQIVLL